MKKRGRSRLLTILLVCLVAVSTGSSQTSLPAFPGASGFGSTTPGGRGGAIKEVTNLNDSGLGSFRAACEATGARIVVFKISGTIFLQTPLIIENPYLTIAGQTAPGDGIATMNEAFRIKTHDVIIRGMRFRPGDLTGYLHPFEIESIHMIGDNDPPPNDDNVYNVIIDHCSLSWGLDKNLGCWADAFGAAAHDVTVQWCISSEALHSPIHPEGPDHAMGMFFASIQRASAHHNLLAHNHARQPQYSRGTWGEGINNVVYNYGTYATEVQTGAKVALIGNYYKTGNDWTGNAAGITVADPDPEYGAVSVYVDGNIGPGRLTDVGDEWDAVDGNPIYRSLIPPFTLSGVPSQSATDAYELVLADAGALPRDPVDQRAIYGVVHGTGTKIASQSDVNGWPLLESDTAPLDSDHDGMPNTWESANGLNPNSAGDAGGDLDGDGYTNVEEYINGLIVTRPTVAYAGIDQSLCAVTTATLTGNTPLLGAGTWRIISGTGTITLPSSPSSTVINLGIGVTTLEWKISLLGAVTTRDTVLITRYAAPTTANAGTDQLVCGVTSGTISGNTPASGTGLWRVVEGPAIITNPTSPTTTVTGLQTGENEFEWAITAIGPCSVSKDTVRITVSAVPTVADAGDDALVCDETIVNLDGNRATVGTGVWNVLIGPAVVDDPTNNDPDATGLQIGENKFEWVITNGVCPPSRDTVVVTVQNSPTSDFSWSITGLIVHFTSLATNASSYSWTFGDGTTSILQNPIHTYLLIRSFRVTHTATNVCGSAKRTRRVNLAGAGPGLMSLNPQSIDFGEVAVNVPATASVFVTNSGNDTLDVESIEIPNGPTAGFMIASGGFSVAPEETKRLDVTFIPTKVTDYNGSFTIITENDTQSVVLNGIGIDGEYDETARSGQGGADFGDVVVGASSIRQLSMPNLSQSPMRVDSIRMFNDEIHAEHLTVVSPTRATKTTPTGEATIRKPLSTPLLVSGGRSFAAATLPALLMTDESLLLNLQYSPKTPSTDSTTLSIFTGSGVQSFALKGSGILARSVQESDSHDEPALPEAPEVLAVEATPTEFRLEPNYPNPFNSSTIIRYALKEDVHVTIRVYNTLGEEIATLANEFQPAGARQLSWNGVNRTGQSVSSGVYYVRMDAGAFVSTNRLIIIR